MPLGFDKVRIFNMALSHNGSKSTVEAAGESTRPASICRTWYDAARLASLEYHNWNFARKSLTLAEHSVDAPENRWAYRYQYPSDCVKFRVIENPAGPDQDAIPYKVEEGDDDSLSIVTDQYQAVGIYTKNAEDPTRFSMHYTLLLSLQLGIYINPEIAGKLSRLDRMQRDLREAIIMAPTVDAQESVEREERPAKWHRGRT